MAKTIWKTALKVADLQEIVVPRESEFLSAREQNEEICVWYRCDPTRMVDESRKIAIIGTGHPAPDDGQFLGTVSLLGGSLIFHIFAQPHRYPR